MRATSSPTTAALSRRGATPGSRRRSADWLCLATAGRDGSSVNIRGTFDANADYRRLDVVALNGGSFIALKDAPGSCPGSGWQLIASQGKRGAAGERGERGLPPRGGMRERLASPFATGRSIVRATSRRLS